jgi:hypothetical protein
MAEVGLISGLARDLQFDQRIDDLRYRDEAMRRSKAIAESRAKLFSDDLDYQNAVNAHDNPEIKQFAQNQIKKIGSFVRENPDWQTNVDKRMQLNLMKRELKDNPALLRGLASDSAYKQYLQDRTEVAKNPQQHDTQAYQDIDGQWKNYLRYGNQYGEEAAKAQGKQAFVYTKPRDLPDINERYRTIGNSFKDMKTKPIPGGRNSYEEYANPESLRAIAVQEYNQNKRAYDLAYTNKGIDPIKAIETGINAHIPKKRDFGDYGLSDALTVAATKRKWDEMDTKPGQSAYQQAFVNKPEGVVNPNTLEQTYGSKPKHVLYDNKGQSQIDNTGNRVYYTGNHKWVDVGGKKQKLVEIYSFLTPEQAKEKGIYEDGAWNPFKGEEIVPEWNKQAELITTQDKDGNDVKTVKVKAFMPVELNESYAGTFNKETHLGKSQLMAQTPNEENSNIPTGTVDEFRAARWSDAQIQEGINSGKIRVK